MKKIYLGMIILFVLTLIGCDTTAIQKGQDQLSNPSDRPMATPIIRSTNAESVVTPNAVNYYSDENHKIITIGKLSVDLGINHIVSETFSGSDCIIEYKKDQSSSSNDSPVKNMIIRELKNIELMDKESIRLYLVEMMPNYENIRIYNNIIENSEMTYLSVISDDGKTFCIVSFGDSTYLIDSDLKYVEDYIFNTVDNIPNYEEIKQNVEGANSFSASIHEIIDYETDSIKYEIIQGKNNKKYSAELNDFGELKRSNFILKDDDNKNMLDITLGEGGPDVITFIDVNLDGYVDIQALDEPIGNDSTYNLYVWDESVNNFVKVKCDTEISSFEVYDGYLLDWVTGNVLIWKDNMTLEKESDEKYHSSNDNTNDKEEDLNLLVKNGLRVFDDQSFSTEFENYGEVKFVSGGVEGDNPFELRLYLTDNDGKVLYSFSDFYGNRWSMLTEIVVVAFKDVNKDGLKDIIIIANYMTGVGENGAVEFPVAGIYFQKDMEFIDISEIDEQINEKGKNANIDEVIKFTKSIDFSKYKLLTPSNTTPTTDSNN